LDYLLEDEEEPKRGWGKLAVVVIALALLGGFGYLRWKQGGFAFVNSDRKPAPVAEPSPGTGDATGTPGAGAAPDTANPNPATGGSASPSSTTPGSVNSGSATSSSATPDAAASGIATTPPVTGSGADAGAQQATPANTGAVAPAPSENPSQTKPPDNASGDKPADSGSTEAQPSTPNAHAEAAETKPSAARSRERKPTPVTPVDSTAEAERYIYGRGVRQDCDRGLRLLKPAAEKANPKAMITLGSLYSSGTCTPRDLPTAYRWFAQALHKEPDNQPLQDDLQKLWNQMTQPERQLAIKLSQ
jgi:hypothetical protein